jgi:hypothetical protein
MGTFAETAIVDYRLSFADQGKQTSVSVCSKQTEVCRFRFPFVENKRKLPFSVSSDFRLRKYGDMETWSWSHRNMDKWGHGDMVDIETSNGKWKTEALVIFLFPLTVCSSCKRKFVHLLTKKKGT